MLEFWCFLERLKLRAVKRGQRAETTPFKTLLYSKRGKRLSSSKFNMFILCMRSLFQVRIVPPSARKSHSYPFFLCLFLFFFVTVPVNNSHQTTCCPSCIAFQPCGNRIRSIVVALIQEGKGNFYKLCTMCLSCETLYNIIACLHIC